MCRCFESHEMKECLWETFPSHSFVRNRRKTCAFALRRRGALEGCWVVSCPPPFWWRVEPVEFLPIYVTYPPWAWWCSLMEPRQGPGTRGRKNRHIQDTNIISITDWSLVQGNLGRNRLETWEDIGMHCLSLLTIGSFLTVLIVRGSTRRYRHDLSQVGRILGFGF